MSRLSVLYTRPYLAVKAKRPHCRHLPCNVIPWISQGLYRPVSISFGPPPKRERPTVDGGKKFGANRNRRLIAWSNANHHHQSQFVPATGNLSHKHIKRMTKPNTKELKSPAGNPAAIVPFPGEWASGFASTPWFDLQSAASSGQTLGTAHDGLMKFPRPQQTTSVVAATNLYMPDLLSLQ
jgi:hypothetical protein